MAGLVMMYVHFVRLSRGCAKNSVHDAEQNLPRATRQEFAEMMRGWGIPTATDVSLAWATASLVFGKSHPAVSYLLVLMAFDDAAVVVIVAAFYGDPDREFHGEFLIFVLVGMMIACECVQRRATNFPRDADHTCTGMTDSRVCAYVNVTRGRATYES